MSLDMAGNWVSVNVSCKALSLQTAPANRSLCLSARCNEPCPHNGYCLTQLG